VAIIATRKGGNLTSSRCIGRAASYADPGAYLSPGTSGCGDRAPGGLGFGGSYFGSPSRGAVAGWIAPAITNSSGAVLDSLNLQFAGEQWRKGDNSNAPRHQQPSPPGLAVFLTC